MGVVVAATHLHLNTKVALKFLNDNMAHDQKVVQRFLREAQSCAQLKSEHVCRVIDFGMEGSIPYIVMELLEGTDLARLVKLRPVDVATAAEYVMQACMGLAEAHAAKIVHRDLKPGNLFLTVRPGGTPLVKVLDFGVAKVAENAQDFSLTQTTNVVGSPGFMSPEQLRSARGVDQRSDIWSLGVILYKIISGRQPFKAEALTDLAISIAMDPVPPLVEAPPAFSAIVMKCLEKDPARRYQNVTELGQALARFTGTARPTTAFFAADESSIQQSQLLPSGALPAVIPGSGDYSNNRLTLTPDPPTTLQGATSSVDLSAPVGPSKSRRGLVIGASAAIAIIIGIGIGVGAGGKDATAVGTPTVVPGVRGDGDGAKTVDIAPRNGADGAAGDSSRASTGTSGTHDTTGGTSGIAGADGKTGTAGKTTGDDVKTGTDAKTSAGTSDVGKTAGKTAGTGTTGGTTAEGADGKIGGTAGKPVTTTGTTADKTAAGTTTTVASGLTSTGSGAKPTKTTTPPVKKSPPTTSTTTPKTTKPKDFGESRI